VGSAHRIRVLVGSAHPTSISGIFTTEIGLLYIAAVNFKLQKFPFFTMKMKALVLIPGTIMLMLATSGGIFSFTHAAAAAPYHEHAGGWEKKLNLTDDQKAQIKQIHKSTKEQINAILTPDQQAEKQQARLQHTKPNLNLSDDQKAKIKGIKQNSFSQIEALLTPEQQQQLQQLRDSWQQRHQQQ